MTVFTGLPSSEIIDRTEKAAAVSRERPDALAETTKMVKVISGLSSEVEFAVIRLSVKFLRSQSAINRDTQGQTPGHPTKKYTTTQLSQELFGQFQFINPEPLDRVCQNVCKSEHFDRLGLDQRLTT